MRRTAIVPAIRALASERRLQVLEWLKDPSAHFPAQVYGDLEADGVCGVLIARKLRIGQPTLSEHMRILTQAGLVRAKRIKQWTFYRRDERRIDEVKRTIAAQV
jgi:ArsR family transcriptional regulator